MAQAARFTSLRGQRVSRRVQLKAVSVSIKPGGNYPGKRSAFRRLLITGDCMLIDSSFNEPGDATFSSWASPSPPSCRRCKTAHYSENTAVREAAGLGSARRSRSPPLIIALADLSALASVLLRGLPLLPPGRLRSNSEGYLPESHPAVVGARWEVKAKEEWKCKKTKQTKAGGDEEAD